MRGMPRLGPVVSGTAGPLEPVLFLPEPCPPRADDLATFQTAPLGLEPDEGVRAGLTVRDLRVFIPGWLASFLAHVGLVVTLAFLGAVTSVPSVISLVALPSVDDGAEMLDVVLGPTVTESGEAGQSALDQLAAEAQLPPRIPVPPLETDFGLASLWQQGNDSAALWGTSAGAGVERRMGDGEGDADGQDQAQFFGVSARGNKFVFVIDCSGSMGGPRWISARSELIRSLRALKPDQMFCVLLYSSDAWSYEGNVELASFAMATPENLDKSALWLGRQIPGGGTLPLAAMREALTLRPDAIYLLSDGELQDDTRGYLLRNNRVRSGRQPVPVHTVSAGMLFGAQLLQVIAQENGGQFQQVW